MFFELNLRTDIERRKTEMDNMENLDFLELNYEELEEISGGKKRVMATSNAHVRTGPGKEYSAIGTAKEGKTAIYTGDTKVDSKGRAWYKVKVGGQTGWICAKYSKIV